MALAIEGGSWLYLQAAGLDISLNKTGSFQLQEFFYINGAGHFAEDICLLAVDIALHYPIGTDDYFGGTVDVADKRAVNAQVGVGINVTFEGGACTDKAGAAGA